MGVGKKIIFIASSGKLDSYLNDLSDLLAGLGNSSRLLDLPSLSRKNPFAFWRTSKETLHRHLERICSVEKPDAMVFNCSSMRFDFQRIRSFYGGKIVFWDMEGPNFKAFRDPSWCNFIDCLFTVSGYEAKALQKEDLKCRVVYLPHGVNVDKFHPVGDVNAMFRRASVFVGRPSPHRCDYISAMADARVDITLYGRKWHSASRGDERLMKYASACQEDVTGDRLVQAYCGAACAVNVLQDQFVEQRTIMNMQLFISAACACPMVTEFVDELPDAFDIGDDVLAYRSKEELVDHAKRLMASESERKRIGMNARKRILERHTLGKRAKFLDRCLDEL